MLDKSLRTRFFAKVYNQIAVAYLVLGLVYLVVQAFSLNSLIGFAIDFRFIVIFLSLQLVEIPKVRLTKSLLIIGSILGIFSLIQIFVLNPDFLTFFGYDVAGVNTAGIPPASHTVASGSELYRAQATLRGPNELGAYLILPLLIAVFGYLKTKTKSLLVLAGICFIGLLLSYSRSALLGLITGIVIYAAISRIKLLKKIPIYAYLFGVTLLVIASVLTWNSSTFQTVVLHNNPDIQKVQSNEGHLQISKEAALDILDQPQGYGLGEAGPSSALDDPEQAKISENFFLQIGLELGIIGMALFIALHYFVLVALHKLRSQPLGYPILLTFIALILTNLLLHTWADEAISITIWALVATQLSLVGGQKKKVAR